MAAALKISFPEFPLDEFRAAIDETTKSHREFEDLVAGFNASITALEIKAKTEIEAMHRNLDNISELLIERPSSYDLLNWDDAVQQFERREQSTHKNAENILKKVSRTAKTVRRASPEYAKLVEGLARRLEVVTGDYLTALRDARWRILALRAEGRRSEQGPSFDDPEELRRYLNSPVG